MIQNDPSRYESDQADRHMLRLGIGVMTFMLLTLLLIGYLWDRQEPCCEMHSEIQPREIYQSEQDSVIQAFNERMQHRVDMTN